jgi:hypothetical protein
MSEYRLILLACRQPFNHGVEGSSPSALTNEIKHLTRCQRSPNTARVCTVSTNRLPRVRLRGLRNEHAACESVGRCLCSTDLLLPVTQFQKTT